VIALVMTTKLTIEIYTTYTKKLILRQTAAKQKFEEIALVELLYVVSA